MLIWEDRYSDILSCTLELVVIAFVSYWLWVENEELAVLYCFPNGLCKAVDDLLGPFNSSLFKLLRVRLFCDTLLF